jgi:hypothetical protein
MINGVHTMFYSSEPEALRSFLKEKFDFPSHDVGDGWLIFKLPDSDMGVHPADASGKEGSPSGTHDISFSCDHIEKTVEELKLKGVEFVGDIQDHGYGWVTYFKVPGDFQLQLFQPKYPIK